MPSDSTDVFLFGFRMWSRRVGSARWEPAPRLLVNLVDEDSVRLESLSWVSDEGMESALVFAPDLISCYGHRRSVGEAPVEVRGAYDGRSTWMSGFEGFREYEFETESAHTENWRPAGRLRLVINDGTESSLRSVAWRDQNGNIGSVALHPATPTGSADVTDLVTAVRPSSEYRQAGEIAANLVNGSPAKWLAPHRRALLEFDLAEPMRIEQYVLTSANDAPDRDPTAWTLDGRVNDGPWQTIDSRAGQAFGGRQVSQTYRVAEPGSYDCYRIAITANNGAAQIQLAEVRFLIDAGSQLIGFRRRAGQATVGCRGVRVVPQSSWAAPTGPVPRTAPAPVLPSVSNTLLFRTYFADQQAWELLLETLRRPGKMDELTADLTIVDDVAFADMTPDRLRGIVSGSGHEYYYVADETTHTSAEELLLAVNLVAQEGELAEARCVAADLWEIDANLSVGNATLDGFVGEDGVCRGLL